MQSLPNLYFKRIFSFTPFLLVFVLASFELKAQTCNSSNYAAGKTVTASATPELGNSLKDGDLNTDWFTGNDGVKWAYVDLGQNYNLCKVVFKWALWGWVPQTIVQGSTNATTWTDLGTVAASDHGIHSTSNTYDYAEIDVSSFTTAYRYVRLYLPNAGAWGPHFKELEVYVKPNVSLPQVSITTPATGTSFVQGANITLNATASVQGSTISKVEFYQGAAKIGEALSTPYQFTWNNVQVGNYTLSAHAQDANGQVGVSGATSIQVTNPPVSSGWSLTGNAGVPSTSFLGTADNNPLIFKTNGVERFRITGDGRMGIKTDKFPSDDVNVALAVGGNIHSRKVIVSQDIWADYVFHKNYKLPTLQKLEAYINLHHHLPDMPSAATVQKNGLDVGDNQALLLQKIEELTLYLIDLNKEVKKLKQENTELKKQLNYKK
jgi:hypothetical protein